MGLTSTQSISFMQTYRTSRFCSKIKFKKTAHIALNDCKKNVKSKYSQPN